MTIGKIKINMVDIALVILAIGAVAFFFTRAEAVIPVPGAGLTSVYRVSFFVPRTDPFVADSINLNDTVVQHGTELSFGRVVELNRGIGYEFHPNSEGVLVGSQWGDLVSLEIIAEMELPAGSLNNGLMIHGNRFAIGQSVTIRAGDSVLFLRISGIEEIG